jgi:hypothetical protein
MPLQTFFPKIDENIPAEVQLHLQLIYQKLNNHALAITTASTKATTISNTTVIQETAGGTPGPPPPPPPVSPISALGTVNNQSGATAYTTQPGDNGALLVLSDAAPIAVTLNTGVGSPWMCFVANQGTGTATLTPATGTISYAAHPGAASMPVLGGYCCLIVFEGTNFWAWTEPIVPVNTPGVAHQFLSAYNAVTGVFTQAQPDFTDISGVATPAQLPVATTSAFGAMKPDGTTVTIAAGVISSVGAGGGITAGELHEREFHG